MERLWLITVLGLVSLPHGASLSCHYCTSSLSWDDCISRKTQVTCAAKMDSCYHGLIKEGEMTSYFKGCESSLQCLSHCNSELCDLSCCAGDLCNNATALTSGPVPTQEPFQCYTCMSTKSWGECESNQVLGKCNVGVPKCLEMYKELTSGEQFFMKLCSSDKSCNQSLCEGAKECKFQCCDNKDCESKPRTSPTPTSPALICQDCHGNGSWAECEKQSACASGFERCREVYKKIRDEDQEGCYAERECRRMKDECRTNGGTADCEGHCCTQHLCTAAVARATRLGSGFLLSACAVLLDIASHYVFIFIRDFAPIA